MARAGRQHFGASPDALRLTNPIAADLDQMRPTPIATLALAAKRNAARGYPDLALFEIGPAFAVDAPDGQKLVGAGVRTGSTPRSWLVPQRPVDTMDAKGDLWALLAAVGVPLEASGREQRRAGVPASGPLRYGAAGTEDGAGLLRRDPSAPAGALGPAGADGGV